jgi:hypothetical protein
MAGEDVRELLIRVNATTELLRSNLTAAERAVANFERDTSARLAKVDSRFAVLGSGLDRLKVGFGGVSLAAAAAISAFSATSLIRFAKEALDYAGSLGEVSQQLGVTAEDLQVYRYAATQVGLSQEEMDQGLGKLTKTLGEAALGAAGPTKLFDALGISIKNADGTIKTAGQTIPEISDALSKIEDPAKRAAIEIAIFGRAGQKLDTLLAGGSKAIDDLRSEAAKLGIVLSNEQIQKADETADKIAKLQFQLKQNIAGTVADNANSILALTNGLASLVSWLGKAITGLNNFRVAHNRAVMQRLAQDAPEGSEMQKMAQRALGQERDYLRQGGLDAARMLNMSGGKPPEGAKPPVDPDMDALIKLLAGAGGGGGGGGKGPGRSAGSAKAAAPKSYLEQFDAEQREAERAHREMLDRISPEIRDAMNTSIADGIMKGWQDGEDARRDAILNFGRDSEREIRNLTDLFETGLTGGTDAVWKSFKAQGLHVIAELMAKMVIGNIGGGLGGGGGLGSLVAGLFGGLFADGGDPPVGKVSIVGERGPEVFVPKVPGTIIPNHALGGGAAPINFTINAPGATAETVAMIRRELANAAPMIIDAANQTTMRTMSRRRM